MVLQEPLLIYSKRLEALLFASDRPLSENELSVHLPNEIDVAEVLRVLKSRYDNSSGVELCRVGKAWAFRTKPEIAEHLNQYRVVERPLSRAAMEVLAIIAYHQPVTRSEIEEIRGISLSRGTLDLLLELSWIKPRGRRRTPGRPLTWGTTPSFLDHFGLADISDLPGTDELKAAGLIRKGQVLGAIKPENENSDNSIGGALEDDHLFENSSDINFLGGDDDAAI